jgi:hypothetical protein
MGNERKVIYKNTSAKISNILYTTLKKKRKFNIYNFITKEIGDTFDNIFNLALKDWIKQ